MRSTRFTIACVRDVTVDVSRLRWKQGMPGVFIHSFSQSLQFFHLHFLLLSDNVVEWWCWGYKCVLWSVTFVLYALYFCERQTTMPYSLSMEQWVELVVQLDRTIAYDFATTNDDSSESNENSKIITQTYLMLAKRKMRNVCRVSSLCCYCCWCCCYCYC